MHQTCVRDVEKIETNKYDADWSVLLHLRWLHLHLLQDEARLGLIRDLFSMSRWTAGQSPAPLLSRRLSVEKKASPFATTADAIDEYRTIEDLFPGLYLTLEVNSCGSLVKVVLLSILTEYPRRKLEEAEDNHNEILRTETVTGSSSGLQQFYCHEEMMP